MKKTTRFALTSALVLAGSAALMGCEVYTRPAPVYVYSAPPPPPPPAEVVVQGPVIDDPSVVAIDIEPPPPERVYVYDPGYPPGCYFYGGFYYYGGYRYPHDVFVNRYVTVNIHENRYVNIERNRQMVAAVRQRDRAEYARSGGRPAAGPRGEARPGPQHEQYHH